VTDTTSDLLSIATDLHVHYKDSPAE